MISRRAAVWLGISVASAFIVVLAWDFLKLTRKPPALAEPAARATAIVIEKSQRQISLERAGVVLKSFEMSSAVRPSVTSSRKAMERRPKAHTASISNTRAAATTCRCEYRTRTWSIVRRQAVAGFPQEATS